MDWEKITAAICTTAIVCFALHNGIDGAIYMSGLTILGYLAGVGKKRIEQKVDITT